MAWKVIYDEKLLIFLSVISIRRKCNSRREQEIPEDEDLKGEDYRCFSVDKYPLRKVAPGEAYI